ncbi:hypothetical protein DFQ26_008943, partial [Actinomortierella ambigua]
MNTSSLTVFCVIDGESTFNAFSVQVDPTKTVDHLKDLIKAKQSPDFDDIVAKSLTLWRVSIDDDDDDDDEQPIVLDSILEKKKLKATRKLSEVFEGPLLKNTDTIHIIVQLPPPRGDLHTDIKRITDKFFAPGSNVATFLDRFVRGLENLPLTTGSVSGLPRAWPRNNDPRTDTRPSLLFLDLPHPSTSNIRSKYPTSDAILQLIERYPTPGSTVPIFGVSGCGKTRGVIELLSRRWGFYFNAAANGLGSGDITTLVDHTGVLLQEDRESNNRQARTITYLLLLSRLKILQHCLTISESHQTFTSA